MPEISSEDLLLVGKVIRPHGLAGLLRVWSYAESEASFTDVEVVFLEPLSGGFYPFEIEAIRPHVNIFLMKLNGLTTLEQAEEYRGAGIHIRKQAGKAKEEGEYFWHELIGLGVYLRTGEYVGKLEYIFPTAGNDIYVVQKGEKEDLIPAIHDVVKEIDLANRRMVIIEMEGLLDLNEV